MQIKLYSNKLLTQNNCVWVLYMSQSLPCAKCWQSFTYATDASLAFRAMLKFRFFPRRSDVIASQHFLCAGCGTEVEPSE